MARKKKPPEHENHERWLVSYADFITLLFAFFVVMFATSQVDSQKVGRFVESVNSALDLKGPFPSSAADPIGGEGATGVTPPDVASLTTDVAQSRADVTPRREQVMQLQSLRNSLLRYLSRPDIRSRVRAVRDRRGLTLSLSETGLFNPGTDRLLGDAYPRLEKLAALLYGMNVQILVEGHTDDSDVSTPRFPSNWDLSAARAVAVIRFLVDTGRVPAYRFAAVGYGPYRPIAPNDTPEGQARNRRVDLVLIGVDPIVVDRPADGGGSATGAPVPEPGVPQPSGSAVAPEPSAGATDAAPAAAGPSEPH